MGLFLLKTVVGPNKGPPNKGKLPYLTKHLMTNRSKMNGIPKNRAKLPSFDSFSKKILLFGVTTVIEKIPKKTLKFFRTFQSNYSQNWLLDSILEARF